jgi:hypothetical protein
MKERDFRRKLKKRNTKFGVYMKEKKPNATFYSGLKRER